MFLTHIKTFTKTMQQAKIRVLLELFITSFVLLYFNILQTAYMFDHVIITNCNVTS